MVKVLEFLGHEVVFPRRQTCCGQPMYNNGFHGEARALARRMIDVFEGHETVVTPSASCAAMVRKHYAELFAGSDTERRRAEQLAARTFEFVELLTKVLEVDFRALGARWPGSATYHYSCHSRDIGLTDETIRLLSRIDGLEYRPLERLEQCCGFGGTFAINYPRISGEIVRDKVACIAKTGAGTVICSDAGCALNIAGACHRLGVDVAFKSAAELLAEGLGLLARVERGA